MEQSGNGSSEVRAIHEAVVAVADGRIPLEEFAEHHVEIVSGEPAAIEELMNLLSCAMAQLAA